MFAVDGVCQAVATAKLDDINPAPHPPLGERIHIAELGASGVGIDVADVVPLGTQIHKHPLTLGAIVLLPLVSAMEDSQHQQYPGWHQPKDHKYHSWINLHGHSIANSRFPSGKEVSSPPQAEQSCPLLHTPMQSLHILPNFDIRIEFLLGQQLHKQQEDNQEPGRYQNKSDIVATDLS